MIGGNETSGQLDLGVHVYDQEESHPCDSVQDVSRLNTQRGNHFSWILLEHIKIQFKENASFLGLAAGYGVVEKIMANDLSISDITFVDKAIPRNLDNAIQEDVAYIEEGIFTFLDRNTKLFSLVTLIGVEYIVENSSKFKEILQLLSKSMEKDGILFIYPFFAALEFDPKELGFEELGPFANIKILKYSKKE